MAKFKFRLAHFLHLRERIEEQKKLEYGLALVKLEREKQIRDELYRRKDNVMDSFRAQIHRQIDPHQFRIHNDYIEWLKKRIEEQEKLVLLAQNYVEEKRQELVDAMKDRRILEKLREKELAAFFRAESIAEQKVLDEVVSYRYKRKQIAEK